MTSQLELTESAHARRNDPSTSHDAAASVSDINEKQRFVLEVFKIDGQHGFTDEEMCMDYDGFETFPSQSWSGLRTRRHELTVIGKLIDSGERRLTKSGRKSIVWKLAAYTQKTNERFAHL